MLGNFARLERQPIVVHHDQGAAAMHHRPHACEIERHHRDLFQHDVFPDIELGPVRQRKHPHGLALPDPCVEQIPQFRPLIARVPAMAGRAEREDPLFRPALLLVAARAAEGGIELMVIERLLQRIGLHDLGMQRRAGSDRIDAAREAVLVHMHDQIEPEPPRGFVAKRDHVAELPGGVDMQQREGEFRRIERLERDMQHDAGVLADRIQHHRLLELGNDVAHDLDGLGFKAPQMSRQHVSIFFGHGDQRLHPSRRIASRCSSG